MTANLAGDVTMRYVDLRPEEPGTAVPVLLLHGFGTTFDMNWRATGWTQALADAGRRVLGPDLRGHGGSDKPTDSGSYLPEHYVADLVAMLDELGVARVDAVGYSMGARLAWELALRHPARVRSLVLGGFGPGDAFAGTDLSGPGSGDTPFDHVFRTVAALPGNDPAALAACARGQASRPFTADRLPVGVPVLLVSGARDTLAAGAEGLASRCGGTHVAIPGRDHANAVSSRVFKQAVVEFLAERARGGDEAVPPVG
ncbi:alpha/beta hydrolase family protein [Nocardiopsis sp. Huas11]|uniref:alpha/beta fold hydrolase n=1 Tax=Nocardiopsis sp. Huas11 TaxID=2183912 RepID=UPI000EAE6896|nr:alpha/beta hydrolase [Nocardiopsis sp. Huas11]RKS04643.1 alpha/beta hydrolase family protein [Nocardiopsis sp. Huas11]